MERADLSSGQPTEQGALQSWTDPTEERKADEEIRTLDPLLGKEMLYH